MTGRPRVLFVDDEPRILAGLRRMLRSHRDRWDMCFAEGGEEALAALRENPCDVIVSDYRMPGMNGAELLERVREQYPTTARVILSGQTNEDHLASVMALAHEFLSKPSTPEQLVASIERLIGGRDRAPIQSLPSPPGTLVELIDALQGDDTAARSVGTIIEGDPALTAKVLHLVNSSAYTVGREVSDVGQAVALLGLHTIRSLVMMHDLIRTFDVAGGLPVEWIEGVKLHSVETSRLCRMFAAGTGWESTAATAGLLHEVGQLVIAATRPEEFARTLALWHRSGETAEATTLCAAEAVTLDACHIDAGADLLRFWGLPGSVVEAVVGHAAPEPPEAVVDPGTAVALAHLVVEADLGAVCGPFDGPALDEDRLGEAPREAVSRWRRERSRQRR
ncbi:HDOD domain-containing protein [Amorphoplanes digitatis]|uniref:HD-like signal output (HDOD) protein n=1 Tax=Actinoplanes digitatis TaxID=1868 RepID=A0A7W7MRD7_9ACTN|nr:HDOD domain-containing protein [Actinoplanes digitatis]MBB4764138.1 HD-like signal output (HDOD) protein [Actinoplanes digitatis]GID97527.1 two-component system response regulator [Actinoplanes digitatis]